METNHINDDKSKPRMATTTEGIQDYQQPTLARNYLMALAQTILINQISPSLLQSNNNKMNDDEDNDRQNANERLNNKKNRLMNQKHIANHKRYCKVSGCSRVVKSQGLCQRHGAKPKLCNVKGCTKQAQGSFEGMCIAHFKNKTSLPETISVTGSEVSQSVSKREDVNNHLQSPNNTSSQCPQFDDNKVTNSITNSLQQVQPESIYERIIPLSIGWQSGSSNNPMPLAFHLEQGYTKRLPLGWHRNDERIARALNPVYDIRTTLEEWESELAWEEILLLTGMSDNTFIHLDHAWGQGYPEFHQNIVLMMCNRLRLKLLHEKNLNETKLSIAGKEKQSCHEQPIFPASGILTANGRLSAKDEGAGTSKDLSSTPSNSNDESLVAFAATDSVFDSSTSTTPED